MGNLITIQVTDEQLAQLQCLVAESAEDANLLEQALAVPIPGVQAANCEPLQMVRRMLVPPGVPSAAS